MLYIRFDTISPDLHPGVQYIILNFTTRYIYNNKTWDETIQFGNILDFKLRDRFCGKECGVWAYIDQALCNSAGVRIFFEMSKTLCDSFLRLTSKMIYFIIQTDIANKKRWDFVDSQLLPTPPLMFFSNFPS